MTLLLVRSHPEGSRQIEGDEEIAKEFQDRNQSNTRAEAKNNSYNRRKQVTMARRYKDAPSIMQDEKVCFLSGTLEGLEQIGRAHV